MSLGSGLTDTIAARESCWRFGYGPAPVGQQLRERTVHRPSLRRIDFAATILTSSSFALVFDKAGTTAGGMFGRLSPSRVRTR